LTCDAHCHFFSQRFFETLASLSGYQGPAPASHAIERLGWEPPGEPEALADRWRTELDRHGIDRAALIASVPGDESSVAAAVARHPSRFVGFFFLDPTADDAAARATSALRASGLRATCLFPAMHGYALHDERVLRVVQAVAAVPAAVLFVHCGVLSVGARKKLGIPSRFDFRLGNPLDVQRLATAYPRLPIVVPHFGAGFLRELLMVADQCGNVYCDTSSSNAWLRYHPGLTLEAVFAQAIDVFGPERVLFGTDSSFFPRGWQRGVYDRQRSALEAIQAPPDVQARIFGGNFNRLFP
jgi:predicted TIM-barrel fold metal-dependent hydrolase